MSFLAALILAWLITLMCCAFDLLAAFALGQYRNAWFYVVASPVLFVVVLVALCVQLYGSH